MKTLKLLSVLIAFIGLSFTAIAQKSRDSQIKDWERAKAYTKEYMDAMPAESYAFKPTPEMRSFADQMLHLSDANYGFISVASGVKSPVEGSLEKMADKSKDKVIKATMDSYDFVINGIKNVDAAAMKEMVKLFGRFDMSKEEAFEKAFEHQTHHRGQTTPYLRLVKVTPPQEKLF